VLYMCHVVSFFSPHKAKLLMVINIYKYIYIYFFKFLLRFALVMLLCAGTKILLRQPNFIHFCCFITFNIIFGQEVYLHICYEISVLLNISHCTVNMCIIMFSTLCVWMFTLIISLWDWNSVVKKTFSVE
jgi:hypothetical protein